MNTRLQVEHPVTELVTRPATSSSCNWRSPRAEPLPFDQREVDGRRVGHAVEVRLYAEDAEAGFLPATGRIEQLRWPGGEGIRVDAGVAEDDEVSDRFDPMLAKIIAHGPDRATALDRLTAALDGTVVLGLITNLRFLRWLVRQPVVRDGQARIDTLERIWPPDDWSDRTAIPDAIRAAAAATLLDAAAADVTDPWRGGWRMNAPRTARLEIDGELESTRRHRHRRAGGSERPRAATRSTSTSRAAASRSALRHHRTRHAPLVPRPGTAPPGPSSSSRPCRAPSWPSITAAGDTVEAGEPVVTLEAMKMEHVVAAPRAGTVREIAVREGEQVSRGQRLASVE